MAAPAGLDPAFPVITICETGARAGIAASVLARQGYDAIAVVGGGVLAVVGALQPV